MLVVNSKSSKYKLIILEFTMKVRKKILPNNLADWCSFMFILIVIPIFYWFELFIVLPKFYLISSPWYWFHFLFCTFIMINVVSNFVAVIFVDTSISAVNISLKLNITDFCTYCELPIPPRCWHCHICKQCILKRDHHCTFSGCCIGHLNHRFFIMFLSYLFIGCCYALYFNVFFTINYVDLNLNMILKVIFPLVVLLLEVEKSISHCIIILLLLNAVGLIISGILLNFHLRLIFRGSVTYEYNRKINLYDLGLKYNIINVLGTRWYLTWISPFINSTIKVNNFNLNFENKSI